MSGLSLPAYAKINLALDVLGLRPDGYHEVSMVMQSVSLADRLSFTRNPSGQINLKTNYPGLSPGEDNLVVRAASLLQERVNSTWGVEIYLEKNIPLAAGLAGGSADAAATLQALNHLWELNLTTVQLVGIGALLGADIPFCLVGGTVWAQGIGEHLTTLPPVPKLWLVLVKPDFGVQTGEVYRYWDGLAVKQPENYTSKVIKALELNDFTFLINSLGNDLEKATFALEPEVLEIKQEFCQKGALTALMSGSGPTVFGVTRDQEHAKYLAAHFQKKYRQVFIATTLN